MSRTWYRIANAADDPSTVDIHINDFIGDWLDDYWGFGVTARTFLEQLSKLPENTQTIRVHLNSPGGDVFAATQIANALRDQQASKGRTVETVVDGLAASAATIIMMAGNPVRIADNGVVMVHNPWTIGAGNAKDMRKLADDLDVVRDTIVATYKWHSALSEKELIKLMDAETWMDADEAISNGFATEKVTGLAAAASLDRRALSKLTVPEKFQDRVQAWLTPAATPPAEPAAATAAEVLRVCREGGCLDLAEALLAGGGTLQQVTAKVEETKTARAQAEQRARAIMDLCARAKCTELAPGYISGAMSADAVRAHLTVITAKLDKVEIDGSLSPEHRTTSRAIDRKAIYARLNQQPRA